MWADSVFDFNSVCVFAGAPLAGGIVRERPEAPAGRFPACEGREHV